MEPSEIVSILEKIADSGMSIDKYLKKHKVPFSRPQYFRYKARFADEGVDGLIDRRNKGNNRKLTPDAEGFIRGVHQANPRLSLHEICDSVEDTLGIRLDRSTISRFLSGVGEPIQWPRPVEPERISTPCGGFEVIGATDGDEAYAKAVEESPDLIVLDIMMPRQDGYAVLFQLRKNEETKGLPVIVLTAKEADFPGLTSSSRIIITRDSPKSLISCSIKGSIWGWVTAGGREQLHLSWGKTRVKLKRNKMVKAQIIMQKLDGTFFIFILIPVL